MGAGVSKEEQLYQAVQNGNHQLVKSLRREGASLEFLDKEGRTPLILACARQDLFEMVITLLNLGANLNAYRPGSNGGFPLHHAAKRGLEKAVVLLISRGADPLCINDDGQTPLEMARLRGHTSIVRIIEDRISLFSGMIREVCGPGLLEVLLPQWITKKVWAVVLPCPSNQRHPPRHELVIYQSSKIPQPRTTISLWKTELEEPKWSSGSPMLIITDTSSKTKYKLLSEVDGDKAQLDRLYRACRGIPREAQTMGYPVAAAPAAAVQKQDDAAMAMAINASLQTATSEAAAGGWGEAASESCNGWGPPEAGHPSEQKKNEYAGWADGSSSSTYNGWGSSEEAGPSKTEEAPAPPAAAVVAAAAVPEQQPSAPPLPEDDFVPGPIHYPQIDTSPVNLPFPVPKTGEKPSAEAEKATGSQCVVCWDAPAQGVCIPCGHMAGCMDCLQEIKNKKWGCPVCRSSIEQVVKVFAV